MYRLGVWLFGLLAIAHSALADTMDWFIRDWPPVNILQGPQQGQGAYDVMLNRLIAALPQYDHQLHISTLTMRQQMMQQQKSHCLFGLLKTPQRQTFLQFSEPVAVIPNLQLVARADHPLWRQLEGKNAVDLSWLFGQAWRGMVEQHRTYPAPISEHLNEFIQVSATETNLAQMLKANRADYVLEYADRMHYLAQDFPDIQLKALPLLGLPAVTEVYVACSINEHAKEQIKAVNQALQQLRQDPQYRSALLDWLSPDSRVLIKNYMARSPIFDQRFEQSGTAAAAGSVRVR
ncbi:TIGR02285 family protein [Rheinheimera texasensis]|uniref:TIGR02285 family protein n=1 Tax=Rheinheimera texasensis TaxID=306205 RepID=UPI0012FF000D|nr:TIGR02285 family protein [Rheinheimera texasensis]